MSISEIIIQKLKDRVNYMPNLEPRISCSSWFYPKIFGTDLDPKVVATEIKLLIKKGEIIECVDDNGMPSFVLKEFYKN